MPGGGRLVVETENVVLTDDDAGGQGNRPAGDYVRLRVCDPSNGIAPLLRFRRPDRRPGEVRATIPGLQEVFESAEQCGGWIECESDQRRGARLDLYLPRARMQPTVSHIASSPRLAPKDSPTILLVDDEPMLRDLGRNVLMRNGYQVLVADNGSEAVEMYRHETQHIDLVILDLTMPALSGDDTFRQLLRINPDVRVLFCSGYPSDQVKSLGHKQVLGFVSKPYRNEDLVNAVGSALD
jgi:CheY-like chemotaxis protein